MILSVIGLDIGSTMVKGVLFNGQIMRRELSATGWQPALAAEAVCAALLSGLPAGRSDPPVVATGYGRVSAARAALTLTEITCHARGAIFLDPAIRTVLDIGGQDCKAISIDAQGDVLDFQMNDRCAAGTGKFLQAVCTHLNSAVEAIDILADGASPASLTSTCAVFAESEIVGMLATGKPREAVAAGALRVVVERAAGLVGRLRHAPPILLAGGLARSVALKKSLHELTGEDYHNSPDSHYCGAIGAALLGMERLP